MWNAQNRVFKHFVTREENEETEEMIITNREDS